MRNVDGLDQKYYNAYKSNYDTDGELHEAKNKRSATNSFNWLMKQITSQNQMKKQKRILKRLKNERNVLIKRGLLDI